jgi:hypothetical protein
VTPDSLPPAAEGGSKFQCVKLSGIQPEIKNKAHKKKMPFNVFMPLYRHLDKICLFALGVGRYFLE